MKRLPSCFSSIASLLLLSAMPVVFAAQAPSQAAIGFPAGTNADQQAIPPFVEQQLRAKARAENPPTEGLHLSNDGESYTYASSAVAPGGNAMRANGYQATLGRCLSGGIEVSADQSDLSLKFWPVKDALFASPAIEKEGRLIYASKGVRYEYEFRKNGLKEDIVLEEAPSRDISLMFALRQDGNLDFRLDAKGNLLVYGPGALLSGFVQTGDDKSAELIMKARKNAKKDNLLYIIPAPVILDAGGRQYKNMARYTLDGSTLTLHTDDLSVLQAPVIIDPSIVVTTTADFATGNDEGMISFDTNAISRAVQSGGSVGAWTPTASFTTARYCHTSVAYNGYMYVIGGYQSATPHYLNDVQFAPINANGTVGTWTATTSFTTARAYHTSVAYNGYIYVIGGYGGTHYNDVQYAPVQSDGTLGTWSTTSAFGTPRRTHKSVVYNGYLYILGGFAGGTTYFNDVQFAPINADGTVGAWATTTSFTTGRYGHTSVTYDGFLYVIGGYSGVYMSDVQFARIHADGTVGTWAFTTSLAVPHFTSTSLAYNGYLYVIGGSSASGTYLNDVQFAAINANGTIGAWSASSTFASARYGHTSVTFGGYLYVIGGTSGSIYNDVQVATVSAGANALVGAWTATSSFITPRFGHASVANDGYLYVLGGQTSGGYTNTVQYAAVNADGTLGTWTITNPFTTARSQHASVVYNGYLYVMGGLNVTAFSSVQVAPITADGLVGAWTATTSFTTARYNLTSVAYNGYLYIAGGQSTGSTFFNDVQYAPINANGTIGAWTATTSFTTARATHTSVVYGGYLYVIGGYGASGYLDDVRFAAINPSTGAVGAWTATTALTVPNGSHASAVSNGCLYVIGGCNTNGCFLDDVRYAPLNANGTVGDWTATTSFTTGRDLHRSVVCNGYLYILGGNDGSYLNDVQFAPLQASGVVGAWASTAGFTTARGGHASAAYNGYLYVIGGYNGTYLNDVQFAPINDNGTIGSWTSTTSFTTARAYHTAMLANGCLYVIGGYNGSYFNDIQFAPVNANGTVGTWTATTGFTTGRGYHTSALVNGYLYVIGGYNGSYLNDVQFAPVNSDSTIGAWTATTSFATPRFWHTSAAYNGRLYVIGGTCNTGYLNDVQYASINADGTVGSWYATASFTYARKAHASAARNGYLYVIGGYNGVHLNDVQSAPINSDGTLGAWEGTTRFTTARQMPSSVAYNGNLYVIGGYSGSTPLSDILGTPIKGTEARGRYSKLVDLGSDQIVDSISFSNSGHNGATNLACAVAPSGTAVFGTLATINGARHSVQYGLDTCGRWVWASFDLDDTQSATIDGGGLTGRGDVLDFTVNYYALAGIGDSLDAAKTTAVHLTWTPVPGATSYSIQRCNAGGGHCTPATIDSTTNAYYDDSVLGDGSSYWYAVATVNGTCSAP